MSIIYPGTSEAACCIETGASPSSRSIASFSQRWACRLADECSARRCSRTKRESSDQRGPLQIVDVIERSLGGNQRPHDFSVTEMSSRNQGRAVITASHGLRVTAAFKRYPEHRHVVTTAAMVMMS
jgi:hypothetical protein